MIFQVTALFSLTPVFLSTLTGGEAQGRVLGVPEPAVPRRQGGGGGHPPERAPVQQVPERLQEVLQGRRARPHAGERVIVWAIKVVVLVCCTTKALTVKKQSK